MLNYAVWRFFSALLAAVFFLMIAEPARADVPFAFVFYYGRGGQWATIPIALLIELLVLRLFFEMSWTRAVFADLTMNFASTIVGIGALPFIALIGIVGWSAADIMATIVVAAFVDVVIEGTTERGGSFGKGVVFRLWPPPANEGLWTLSVLHNFKGKSRRPMI